MRSSWVVARFLGSDPACPLFLPRRLVFLGFGCDYFLLFFEFALCLVSSKLSSASDCCY